MSAIEIWHHFLGQGETVSQDVILAALAQAGVSTHQFDPVAAKGPGVLFFDRISSPLCEFLCEVSRGGLERVLAVATSRAALAEGGAWVLLQHGAADAFAWEHSDNPAQEIAARFERWEIVDQLVHSPLVCNNLVGHSSAWIRALRQVVDVARFTGDSMLITGESGTGKELVARLIHTLNPKPDRRDLVVLDCTTIVPELSGSEFFGHERGAFTGAVSARDGAFALADGGTLFLDEVGELPLTLQAELLRVVQERTYKRIGSNTWRKTNFRLICATNRDLRQEEAQGRFRRDLYYRIANWTCHLPPLSERTEDILPLVRHYLRKLRSDDPPELDEPVRDYLLARDYPGNVRDLKQLVTRIAHRHVGPGPVTAGDIPEEERPGKGVVLSDWRDRGLEQAVHRALASGVGLKEIGRAAEEVAERLALEDAEGNLQRAAQALGVTDRALQMRRAARRQNNSPADTDHTK